MNVLAEPRRDNLAISEFESQKFREYFYRRTGIAFGDNKRYYVDKRLAERIAATESSSFDAYFTRLRRHDSQGELDRLINLFTINETYFYREAHQFACLTQSILPELTATRPRGARLRILSLPCSTGEEPYSIAIHLLENWPDLADYEVELVAGDIDTGALEAARRGVYGERALEKLSFDIKQRYFTPLGDGQFQLIDPVRSAVQFVQVNANDPLMTRRLGPFDVIFCRNMLIYFDDLSRRRTVDAFYATLTEGGFICLGHAESMSRISPLFQVRPFAEAIVYQKPGGPR